MSRRRATTAEVIGGVLGGHPDVVAELEAADAAAWAAVDPVLLELCRLRVAMLLGAENEIAVRSPAVGGRLDESLVDDLASWPTSPGFGAAERACLAFTEQFVIDVARMDDATANAVGDVLGPDGLADFVAALLVIEQRQRLRLIWSRLFEDVPA